MHPNETSENRPTPAPAEDRYREIGRRGVARCRAILADLADQRDRIDPAR